MTQNLVPDITITKKEVKEYGYFLTNTLFPLSTNRARELFDLGILALYPDNTESYLDTREELEAHAAQDGLFAIKRDTWMYHLDTYHAIETYTKTTQEKAMHMTPVEIPPVTIKNIDIMSIYLQKDPIHSDYGTAVITFCYKQSRFFHFHYRIWNPSDRNPLFVNTALNLREITIHTDVHTNNLSISVYPSDFATRSFNPTIVMSDLEKDEDSLLIYYLIANLKLFFEQKNLLKELYELSRK